MSTRGVGDVRAVLFDVDGTLVDSNDAHAHSWVEALHEGGVDVSFADVRRAIGMGGDKLLPLVAGIEESSPQGTRIVTRRSELFRDRYLPAIKPFRDADRLVAALRRDGARIVAASSAKRKELEPLLDIAGVKALMHGATSSDDAEESKPDPDIIEAALHRAGVTAGDAVMVGDTPYDIEAAARAGVPTIAFRCGGWDDAALSGAIAIYDGPWDLLRRFEASPLGSGRRSG